MITRGFCRDKTQLAPLAACGLPEKAVYLDGRGAEDFEHCMASFRGRPGVLMIAPDLRVFGDAKRDVAAAMTRLERAKIRVIDIIHPQHETIAEMLQHASVLISGARFHDKRTARKRGRDGGVAKGAAAQKARATIPTDGLIRNVVAEASIDWETKARVTGVSEATLRRHYWVRR